MDCENKFADCKKDKNGFTKIRIRANGEADYICVLAKPMPLTEDELNEYGHDEVCSLNLTKFELKNLPGTKKLYGDVSGEFIMYFNGAECAWKFYDDYLSLDDEDLTDEQIQQLADEEPWFEPHNDEAGNYGDESVHAVYDL